MLETVLRLCRLFRLERPLRLDSTDARWASDTREAPRDNFTSYGGVFAGLTCALLWSFTGL